MNRLEELEKENIECFSDVRIINLCIEDFFLDKGLDKTEVRIQVNKSDGLVPDNWTIDFVEDGKDANLTDEEEETIIKLVEKVI